MSGSIRLSFEASPAALELATATSTQFTANAGLAADDAERVQRAVQVFVAFSVHQSYHDVSGGEIELSLDLVPNGVQVAVHDWGRPWRRGGGSFGPLPPELAEAAELDAEAQLDNLADEGKLLTLQIPCTHDANARLATAPTKPARTPKQLDHHSENEVEIRLATPEDADAICGLLYDNYGLDYVHAEFYRPVIIAIGIERGILASTVAYAGDELVGHIALFGSGPMSTMGSGEAPEMAAALIAEEWRGLWLYNRLHDFAVANARSLGVSAVFGQSTTAHVVSQRLGVGSGYQFTAVMIGGAPPTMAKGQTKRGAQVSARGGLAYAVLPLAASPVLTATLPEQYAAVLRRIAEEAGYAIVAPDGADPAGPAAEEPADRTLDPGRRDAPQLPARGPGHSLDGAQPRPGLGPHHAAGHRVDAIEPRQVDHHATVQRDALPGVPGARAPRNDRHPGAEAGPHHGAQIIDRAGSHRQVSLLAIQLAAQDRGIPVEVLRQPGQGVPAVDHLLGAE